MIKLTATIVSTIILALSLSFPAKSAPRTFIKVCLYKETLNPDLSVLEDWHLYGVQDVPRSASCPTPQNPVIYVNGHAETIDVSYSHTVGNTAYYTGRTDAGQDCTVTINSLIVAD